MKKTLTILSALISLSALSQSKPVHLEGKEVDSTKTRLSTVSQKIAQAACLTQGQAGEIQQLLQELFNTIVRKEEKTEPPKPKQ